MDKFNSMRTISVNEESEHFSFFFYYKINKCKYTEYMNRKKNVEKNVYTKKDSRKTLHNMKNKKSINVEKWTQKKKL